MQLGGTIQCEELQLVEDGEWVTRSAPRSRSTSKSEEPRSRRREVRPISFTARIHTLNILTALCRGQRFFVSLDFDFSFGISPALK
jgi:hypothetical protein